jgi:predicted aspartyl protease
MLLSDNYISSTTTTRSPRQRRTQPEALRERRMAPAKVHTAIGEEHGYWVRVAELTVLGVTTANFALTVFPLGHKDIDGLVGMNFLRHFNFEIRPADRQILVELIEQ